MAAMNVTIPAKNHPLNGLSSGNATKLSITVSAFLAVATDVAGVAPLCLVSSVNANAPR